MLSLRVREPITRFLTPAVKKIAQSNANPDVITVIGTIGTIASALYFYPHGNFFWGTVVVTVFVLTDLIDGLLARTRGTSSLWGAFLDSTLDRVGDGAIFSGLAIWYAREGDSVPLLCATLFCLVFGAVTSYAKARAESLGMTCNVGFAERAERLIAILVAIGLSGLGIPYLLPTVLWLLCAATGFTVYQRFAEVRRQATKLVGVAPPPPSKAAPKEPRAPRASKKG